MEIKPVSMAEGRTANFYTYWAPVYDRLARYTPGIRRLRRDAVAALDLAPGDRVVEVGCGPFPNLAELEEAVGPDGEVVGIDIAPGAVQRAQDRAERHGWANVEVIEADASVPPVDGPFDGVLFSFSIGMFQDPANVLERYAELVEAGTIVNMHIRHSETDSLLPVNWFVDAFEILTAPSTFKRGGSRPSIAEWMEKVRAAEQAHESLCRKFTSQNHVLGTVRIDSGQI